MQSMAALSLCGTIMFGIIAFAKGGWSAASWQLIVMSAAVGVFDYVGMIAFRKAMNSGSLSLVWCAVSLEFMPAVVVTALLYHEKFTVCYFFALLAVIVAICFASFGGKVESKPEEKDGGTAEKRGSHFLFGMLLIILMVCFSTAMLGLKIAKLQVMPWGGHMLDAPGTDAVFYSVLYLVVLFFTVGDMIVLRTWTSNWQCWTGMGLNSAGTLVAFGAQLLILSEPATITFALPQSITILVTALISTLFMGEQRTTSWYGTIGFSL